MMKLCGSSPRSLRRWRQDLLFAACRRSLISLIIRLICCDVLSNSFSWRFKFSRNSGESRRQSANSSAANPDPPLITIFLRLSLTQTTENHLEILLSTDITFLLVSHSCFILRLNICVSLSIESFSIAFVHLRRSQSRYSSSEINDVTTLAEIPFAKSPHSKYLSSSNPLSHFFSRSDENHRENSDKSTKTEHLTTTCFRLRGA